VKVGFIGLGKMGSQMVTRLLHDRHDVVVFDIDPAAVGRAQNVGARVAADRQDLVNQLGARPVVWLMIPAQFVDDELKQLLALLPKGSILVDGGNSDYRKTLQRSGRCGEKGIELVDVGTSGGVLGLNNGFSMMIGGSTSAVRVIEPIVKSLAQPQGYRHFGPTGTGHYIKMVHNAIEYGLMESYAEGYRLLKEGPFSDIDLASVASVWQHGSIVSSKLNGLVGEVLQAHPELDHVEGFVAETGEAGWALEVAREKGIAMPAIQAATEVRAKSEQGTINFATKLLAALRGAFGGHAINRPRE